MYRPNIYSECKPIIKCTAGRKSNNYSSASRSGEDGYQGNCILCTSTDQPNKPANAVNVVLDNEGNEKTGGSTRANESCSWKCPDGFDGKNSSDVNVSKNPTKCVRNTVCPTGQRIEETPLNSGVFDCVSCPSDEKPTNSYWSGPNCKFTCDREYQLSGNSGKINGYDKNKVCERQCANNEITTQIVNQNGSKGFGDIGCQKCFDLPYIDNTTKATLNHTSSLQVSNCSNFSCPSGYSKITNNNNDYCVQNGNVLTSGSVNSFRQTNHHVHCVFSYCDGVSSCRY